MASAAFLEANANSATQAEEEEGGVGEACLYHRNGVVGNRFDPAVFDHRSYNAVTAGMRRARGVDALMKRSIS
ncbi:MAG: hypothetical protein FRX49_09018 [Trebouxia sp. A1-2]|nr:MAG: hypothetical protein FRX49_09018 [Trebouxia sp. A1-2]